MTGLSIEKLTGHRSIQDLGRPGKQHLGFSAGGAADEYGFLSANQLVGNEANMAAIEIMLGQVSFKALSDCKIALTGADCLAELNGQALKHWQLHALRAGDVLTLKQPSSGIYTYLAVTGGIDSQSWLGSRSQTLNEQALGFGQPALQAGSIIPLTSQCFPDSVAEPPTIHSASAPEAFYQHPKLTLRFMPRSNWYAMTTKKQQDFLGQQYSISADSNRMGYRLQGQPISLSLEEKQGLSKPVCFGTIQLPDNGCPIVLMKERQTIGGYPTLGTVMQTDLFRLCQMRPGEKVAFTPISVEQAQGQLLSFYRRFSL